LGTLATAERKRLGLRILTPEGTAFDGVASIVVAQSVEGEVGILPRHAPLIAFLKVGETRIKDLEDEETIFATSEGYLSVEEDQVLILVEQAERADEIDVAKVQAELEAAQRQLAEAGDDESLRDVAQAAVNRAENRMRVANA
jgi:F-type H+-transporting ATPase subunit epsilon